MSSSSQHLIRALGRWDLTAIALNTIVGSGIFLLPATVAATVGAWAPLSFLVSGILSLLFANAFAEAGKKFTQTGGPYLYAKHAFGNFVGFEVAWIFWLSRLAAVGASYSVFMTYLAYFFPVVAQPVLRAAIITCIVVAVAYVNIRGVKMGARVTNTFTVAKLLPLLFVALAGLFFLDWTKAAELPAIPTADFMRSVLLVAFAFGGFELATVPAGEAHDPRKHLPGALYLSIAGAVVLYVALQYVAFELYPSLPESKRPLADVASTMIGAPGATLISLGALISTCGYIFGASLAVPRVSFALAEQGQFPPLLAKIHPRFHTPYASIILHAIITWLLTIALSFLSLVIINVLARLVVTGATCAAVIQFRKTEPIYFSFKSFLPYAGILLALYLLTQSKPEELLWGFVALVIGSLLYFPLRRFTHRTSISEQP